MKYLFYSLILCISFTSFAQDTTRTENDFSITTYSVKVNDLEDFKTINWEIIPEMFQYNKPETIVELEFSFKKQPSDNPEINFTEFTLSIKGKSEEIETMVLRAKKTVAKAIEILHKKKD